MANVTFSIFRFDPANDPTPRRQEYKMELEPGITLLNCLNKIKAQMDPSLTYRMSCGSAICGSCAVRANGHAILSCKTQADSLVKDGAIRIDPIGNASVIRDLVVDLEPFWASIRKVNPWLMPDATDNPVKERLQSESDYQKIDHSTTCIMCASCWSDCNVLEVDKKFIGPAALAKAQRFIYDTRDVKAADRLDDISEPHGVWDCTHCGECSTRCPTDAKPLGRIEEIKQSAMAEGIHCNSGARHVLAFRETVGKRGMLDENYAPVRSVGFLNIPGLLGLMPVGLRMLWRGKNPPVIPHSVDKVEEVRNIYSRSEEFRK